MTVARPGQPVDRVGQGLWAGCAPDVNFGEKLFALGLQAGQGLWMPPVDGL